MLLKVIEMPDSTTENINKPLDFTLENVKIKFSRRRSIALHIQRSGEVEIRAPYGTAPVVLHDMLQNKKHWIEKKVREIEKKQQHQLKWRSGEILPFLGESYQLDVFSAKRNKVVLVENNIIQVHIKTDNKLTESELIKKLILKDFKQRSYDYFIDRTQFWIKQLYHDYADDLNIQIRLMSSRWGSCSHNKSMRFNVMLNFASLDCIDYVIVHELCHWQVFNHSRQFYQLLESVLPHRKALERQLREYDYLLTEAKN